MAGKTSSEFERFDNAMRRVLSVSKEELKRRLEADKEAHKDRPKRGPKPKTLGRVSSDRD